MPRAVSIHIGVDRPHGGHVPLKTSENNAWRMAQLANQAGYESLLVLRGSAATRQAVHDVLAKASDVLTRGATLFLSFSGHGCEQPDTHHDQDERSRKDQGWCLADGPLLDDALAGLWRRFADGVRILVVSESCYSGGVIRDDKTEQAQQSTRPAAPVVYRGQFAGRGVTRSAAPASPVAPCIAPPPTDDGIRASLLLLSASRAEQKAQEGLFAKHLLGVWNEGAYRGSYCDLYREVSQRVMGERPCQHPQLVPLGASDPAFALATAFHRGPPPGTDPPPVFRGHPVPDEPVLHG